MIYYLFMVIVVTNVVVAYLLDAYFKLHPLLSERDDAVQREKGIAEASLAQTVRRWLALAFSSSGDKGSEESAPATEPKQPPASVGNLIELADDGTMIGHDCAVLHFALDTLATEDPEACYKEFLLSLARAAMQQNPYSIPLLPVRSVTGHVETVRQQQVLVARVPMALALAVANSLEPVRVYQERVWPIVHRLYGRYRVEVLGQRDGPSTAAGAANGNASSEDTEESMAAEVGRERAGSGHAQFVYRFLLSPSEAREHLKPGK